MTPEFNPTSCGDVLRGAGRLSLGLTILHTEIYPTIFWFRGTHGILRSQAGQMLALSCRPSELWHALLAPFRADELSRVPARGDKKVLTYIDKPALENSVTAERKAVGIWDESPASGLDGLECRLTWTPPRVRSVLGRKAIGITRRARRTGLKAMIIGDAHIIVAKLATTCMASIAALALRV